MWEKLAHEINSSFGCQMTALQVENKWKTMERAYKKTKMRNGSTGHPRAACEFEEYEQQTFHIIFTDLMTEDHL